MYKIFRGVLQYSSFDHKEIEKKKEIFLLIFNKIKYNFLFFFYSNNMKFVYIERKEVRLRLEKHKLK
jgi:hypothetical protein